MKNVLLALIAVPLLSCGNNKNTDSASPTSKTEVMADSSKTETTSISETDTTTSSPSETPAIKAFDHNQWNSLLQKHVSSKGIVDYKGFKKDKPALQSYLDLLAANVPDKTWSNNAVLAYWINTYNANTVKLIVDNYPVKSIKDIKNPWDTAFIKLGNKKYSLGGIENDILRKMNEPRIHFAINCASYSCPNLLNEAYSEKDIQNQLQAVAKSFINDKTKNTISANNIEISSIFDWYGADFKTKGTVIDFLNKYSSVKIDAKAKISFKEYNWNLNE